MVDESQLDGPDAVDRLGRLYDPDSIAVVGASADVTKWGGDVAARLTAHERRRPVYLVNPKGGAMHGAIAYTSLMDLPGTPDLVIMAMPARGLEATLSDALGVGARAIVAVFAGLGETGADGMERETAAVQRVRAEGAVMLGPNCMGLADTSTGLQAVAYLDIPAGEIGLVSQSGGVGEELVARAFVEGRGFSRYVTVGNQADIGVTDVLAGFIDHGPTQAVGVYVEDIRNGREFARAARRVVASGRPVVLLAPGYSEASTRSALTHTGSLAPDAAVLDALCEVAGIIRVATPGQLFDTLSALVSGRRARGRSVAVVSDGGGHGGLAADAVSAAGLDVPQLSSATLGAVRAALPESVGKNPIDFALGTIGPEAYGKVVGALAGADDVDMVLAAGQFGYWQARFPRFRDKVAEEMCSAAAMAVAAEATATPVLLCTAYPDVAAAGELRRSRIPVHRELDAAAGVLARLVEAADRVAGVVEQGGSRADPIPDIPESSGAPVAVSADDYWGARQVLVAAGLPFALGHRVSNEAEALSAARSLGYPVVLKALGLVHKTEHRGVLLGIEDGDSLSAAVEDMRQRLDPPGYCVEEMVRLEKGVELLVGCRWDPHVGPVLVVGMGGVLVEAVSDVQIALAPVDVATAERMMSSLRARRLLQPGGALSPGVVAACGAAAAISVFGAAHPEVSSVEVNPLLVTPERVLCLDARIARAAEPFVGGEARRKTRAASPRVFEAEAPLADTSPA